jgi:hypothetical protein
MLWLHHSSVTVVFYPISVSLVVCWTISSIPMIRLHAFVSGRVQGVFFRKHTEEEVARLGGGEVIRGWVRNIKSGPRAGQVEVVAEGPEGPIKVCD